MTTLVYDLAIAPILQSLKDLDAIVSKAEAHVEADDNIAPETFLQGRLYPNMKPFMFQIQVATDTAKGVAARLTGSENPSWPDDEQTFDDAHARLKKAIDFLSGFKPEDFAGSDAREIDLKLGPYQFKLTGAQYVQSFVLPNFYFHTTTAYNILRHFGVELGKLDVLGGMGKYAQG